MKNKKNIIKIGQILSTLGSFEVLVKIGSRSPLVFLIKCIEFFIKIEIMEILALLLKVPHIQTFNTIKLVVKTQNFTIFIQNWFCQLRK